MQLMEELLIQNRADLILDESLFSSINEYDIPFFGVILLLNHNQKHREHLHLFVIVQNL